MRQPLHASSESALQKHRETDDHHLSRRLVSALSLSPSLISNRRLSLKVSTKIDFDHLFRTSIDEARMLVLEGDEENVKSPMNICVYLHTRSI